MYIGCLWTINPNYHDWHDNEKLLRRKPKVGRSKKTLHIKI